MSTKSPSRKIALARGYQVPVLSEEVKGGIVKYGKKNQFPQEMISYFDRSPAHSAIVKLKAMLTAGRGFDFGDTDKDWVKSIGHGRHIDKILKQVATDLHLHNGWNIQVVWSKDGKSVAKIKFEDFSHIRKEVYESDGKELHEDGYKKGKPIQVKGELTGWYLLSRDWKETKSKSKNVQRMIGFDPSKSLEEPNQIYRYEAPSPGTSFYPKPDYNSAFMAIEIDIKYTEYHLNNIETGFTPSVIFEIMGANPTEEEKDEFVKDLTKALQGPKGKRHVVTWTDGENSGFKIHPVDVKNNDGRYITVDKVNTQKIVTAHRLSSPTLASLPGAGSLGGNGNEIEKGFTLFSGTVIADSQDQIIEGMQDLFDRGGHSDKTVGILTRNPFSGEETINTDEEVKDE